MLHFSNYKGERSVAVSPDIRAPAPFPGVKAFPYRGEGGPLAVDEVPTRAPDFGVSLSNAFDSRITAKLSLALRAARVKIRCPS